MNKKISLRQKKIYNKKKQCYDREQDLEEITDEYFIQHDKNIKLLTIQTGSDLIGREQSEDIWNSYEKQVLEKEPYFPKRDKKISIYETAFYSLMGYMNLYNKNRER